MRSIVCKFLAQLGYTDVDEVSDGAAALAKMNEKLLWFGDLRLEYGTDEWAGVT